MTENGNEVGVTMQEEELQPGIEYANDAVEMEAAPEELIEDEEVYEEEPVSYGGASYAYSDAMAGGRVHYEPGYERSMSKKDDFINGVKVLKGQGKPAVLYILMVIYFLIIFILISTHVISRLVGIGLMIPVLLIALFKYIKYHKDDESSLL